MSLAKLTSLSTQTLSLLLERQRMQTLPSYSDDASADVEASVPSLHNVQITKNLNRLRAGVLELESKEGRTEAVRLLRSQYERMRGMLGEDGYAIESLAIDTPKPASPSPSSSPSPSPPASLSNTPDPVSQPKFHQKESSDQVYSPYTDDPEAGYGFEDQEPGMLLQTQRRMMDDQDAHLDRLSQSINRQHHMSLQINDELDVHHGLLEELDTDIDRTSNRLSNARRRLDRVAKGAKNNVSTVTIGLLILVLLILIIIFKT